MLEKEMIYFKSKAEQYEREEKFDELIQLCNKAIQKGEITPQVFLYKGNAYLGKEDDQKACYCYEKVVKVEEALQNLKIRGKQTEYKLKKRAQAYIELGDIFSAFQEYQKVVKLNKSSSNIKMRENLLKFCIAIQVCWYLTFFDPFLVPINYLRQDIQDSKEHFLKAAKQLFQEETQEKQNNPIFLLTKIGFLGFYFPQEMFWKENKQKAFNLLTTKKLQQLTSMKSISILKSAQIQKAITGFQQRQALLQKNKSSDKNVMKRIEQLSARNQSVFIRSIISLLVFADQDQVDEEKTSEMKDSMRKIVQQVTEKVAQHDQKLLKHESEIHNIHQKLAFLENIIVDIQKQIKPEEEVMKELEKHPEQKKKFFKLLYAKILQQFTFFKLVEDGRVKTNPQTFNNFDKVLDFFSSFEPITNIPGIGQGFKLGFIILEKYRGWRTDKVNKSIGEKINPIFPESSKLNRYISHCMIMLINNEEFNSELNKGIQNQETQYRENLWGKIQKGIYSDVRFLLLEGTTETNFSIMKEIATAHGALISQMLYDIKEKELTEKSQTKEQFGHLILNTLLVGQKENNMNTSLCQCTLM